MIPVRQKFSTRDRLTELTAPERGESREAANVLIDGLSDLTNAMRLRAHANFYLIACTAALLFSAGCITSSPENKAKAARELDKERARAAQSVKNSIVRGGQRQLSIEELDRLTYGYADRYYMV